MKVQKCVCESVTIATNAKCLYNSGYATPKGRAETRKRKVRCIKGGTPWYAGGDEGYAIQDEVIKNILKNRELVTRVAHEPCE